MESKKLISKYSVAPYNFVSLPNDYKAPYSQYRELKGHYELSEDLLNGYIEYSLVNETPLIIGSAERNKKDNLNLIKFMKNAKGEYIIPGNSIRGVIRNNCAILSLSSLEDFIEDERFFFRSFGKGINANEYKDRLDIKSKPVGGEMVTAPHRILGGYIYKDSKDKYVLVPSKKINNQSYFIIREQYLRKLNPKVNVEYMYNEKILDLINNKEKYKGQNNRFKKDLLRNSKSGNYKPYCTEISFDIKDSRTVYKIGKAGEYKYKGYLMCSEFIQGKLAHYVVPKPDFKSAEIMELSRDNGKLKFIDFYKDDLLRTKKKLYPNKDDRKDKEYFLLPKKEGSENGKPIFYGKYKGYNNEEVQVYFGFSPYLRIPYDYSVKDCMPEGYKITNKFSYMDSLFGFTGRENKKIYKSKLSFEDVICVDKHPEEDREYRLISGQPHASSYPSYLEQYRVESPRDIKNYNSSDVKIRGIKNYWGKDYVIEEKDGKDNVSLLIKPLKKGANFKGKIYFKNLTRDELGLLLWSLKVHKKAYETIGYGKAYGFGRVRISDIEAYVENIDEKYSSMVGNYLHKQNPEELINEYKNNFVKEFNINLEEQKSVQELIILKTLIVNKEDANETRYMQLQFPVKQSDGKIKKENEFNLLLPLPTPKEFSKIVNWKEYKEIIGNLSSKTENKFKDEPEKKTITLNPGDIEMQCTQCKKKFILNKAQRKALDDRGLKYPSKCFNCRK